MRVALEARALSAPSGGVKRYVHELIRHLLLLPGMNEWHVMHASKKLLGSFPHSHEHVIPLHHEALFWKWLWRDIPRALDQIQPDIVHFTKVDMPITKKYPSVVTIYDTIPLLFPESQFTLKRAYWPVVLRRSAQLSDHIMTISEASKNDIVRLLAVDPNKITVTPLAIDSARFTPASPSDVTEVRQKYGLVKPYILFVGTIEPRKNVPALIRAFARIARTIPHDLVVTGRMYKGGTALREEIRQSGYAERVRMLDFVASEDLPALYSAADLFVLPSMYEGWGLPVLEAMACGTPVITSDGGSLPEAAGPAGRIVPITSDFEEQLAEAMRQVLSDSELRAHMRESGRVHARKFTWKAVAEKTMEVYKTLI